MIIFDILKLLIQYGADVNSTERFDDMAGGSSAILNAIVNCNFQMVKYLLEHGADINKGTFLEGDGAAFILVTERNSEYNKKEPATYLSMLNYILLEGFNVDQECEFGTALFLAVHAEDYEAIELLLRFNANPNKYIEDKRMTITEYALLQGNDRIIEMLRQ